MRKYLFGLSFLLLFAGAFAQESQNNIKRPTLVMQLGGVDFKTSSRIGSTSLASVIGNKEWSKVQDLDVALGISFINGISEHFDYSVNLFSGASKYPLRGQPDLRREGYLHALDASLHMKLLPDNFMVVPYLSGGVGASLWKRRFEAFVPVGAGLQFRVIPEYFAFANFQYRLPVTQAANYHFLYSLGFGGPIGKDRVVEAKPLPVVPPPPPPPAPAPVDTDGDGIPDTEDKCPTVKGLAKYQGCPIPDTDGDGINDEEDKCPTVPGLAKYQGCPVPDTDGDGINDEEDKCPSVPGLARYQGCPIPDTDGDGINDEEDKCPTVPGVKEYRGCPAPKNFDAANVLFASGKAILLNTGKTELNKFVAFLNENKEIKITIAGHTDNTGGAVLNQKLSESRAKAVKDYMLSKGIAIDRITSVGYGFDKPIADNDTPAGRAKNRRVEFTIDD